MTDENTETTVSGPSADEIRSIVAEEVGKGAKGIDEKKLTDSIVTRFKEENPGIDEDSLVEKVTENVVAKLGEMFDFSGGDGKTETKTETKAENNGKSETKPASSKLAGFLGLS